LSCAEGVSKTARVRNVGRARSTTAEWMDEPSDQSVCLKPASFYGEGPMLLDDGKTSIEVENPSAVAPFYGNDSNTLRLATVANVDANTSREPHVGRDKAIHSFFMKRGSNKADIKAPSPGIIDNTCLALNELTEMKYHETKGKTLSVYATSNGATRPKQQLKSKQPQYVMNHEPKVRTKSHYPKRACDPPTVGSSVKPSSSIEHSYQANSTAIGTHAFLQNDVGSFSTQKSPGYPFFAMLRDAMAALYHLFPIQYKMSIKELIYDVITQQVPPGRFYGKGKGGEGFIPLDNSKGRGNYLEGFIPLDDKKRALQYIQGTLSRAKKNVAIDPPDHHNQGLEALFETCKVS
jgi:hypothetical protein